MTDTTVAASFPVLTLMVLLPLAGALVVGAVAPLRRRARALGLVFSQEATGAVTYSNTIT